jgi:hypothetical protein
LSVSFQAEQRVTRVLPHWPARVIQLAKNGHMLVLQDDGAWGVTVFTARSVPPRVLPPETQGPGVAYGLAMVRRLGPNSLRELYERIAEGHVVTLTAEKWGRLANSVLTLAGAWGFADAAPQRRLRVTPAEPRPERRHRVVLAGLPFPRRGDAVWQALEPSRLVPDYYCDAVQGTVQLRTALNRPLYYGLRVVPIKEWLAYQAALPPEMRVPRDPQPEPATIDGEAVSASRAAADRPAPAEASAKAEQPLESSPGRLLDPPSRQPDGRRARREKDDATITAFFKEHKHPLMLTPAERERVNSQLEPLLTQTGSKEARLKRITRWIERERAARGSTKAELGQSLD